VPPNATPDPARMFVSGTSSPPARAGQVSLLVRPLRAMTEFSKLLELLREAVAQPAELPALVPKYQDL
jgi:hypothetical protein